MMMMKKQFIQVLIFLSLFLFLFSPLSFADDLEEEETTDVASEITSTVNASHESTSPKLPEINSRAYVVIDRNTNRVLCGKNETQKRKMASTTKIMTALVIIEKGNLEQTIEISKKAANTGGSRLGLKTGDKVTIRDLLYGLMLRSGNDAAVALAEYAGSDIAGFSALMNQKAEELGLSNTHFKTPHGLDEEDHYTTAYELAVLANHAMKNKTFATIVGTKTITITINGYPKALNNTNELLGNLAGVYGIKTGFTNGANRCLVTCCKRDNLDIICVVLGADTKKCRTTDSIKLIEYTFKNFEMVNLQEKIEQEFNSWKQKADFSIEKGITDELEIEVNPLPFSNLPIRKDLISDLQVNFDYSPFQKAPLKSGEVIGKISISTGNGDLIAELNIVNKKEIRKKNMWDYFCLFWDEIKFEHFLS